MRLPTKKKETKVTNKSNKVKRAEQDTQWKELISKGYDSNVELNSNEITIGINRIRKGIVSSSYIEAVIVQDRRIEIKNSWTAFASMLLEYAYNKLGYKATREIVSEFAIPEIKIDTIASEQPGNGYAVKQYNVNGKFISVPIDEISIIECIARTMYVLGIKPTDMLMCIKRKESIKEKEFWQDNCDEVTEESENAALFRMMLEKENS